MLLKLARVFTKLGLLTLVTYVIATCVCVGMIFYGFNSIGET
jgi:hypothetical protein